MILLDTNVLIYAFDLDSPFCQWARETIASAVGGDGAAINAVSLAEICVGDADPPTVADRIRSWGVEILDVPAAAADVCATAYLQYRQRRNILSFCPPQAATMTIARYNRDGCTSCVCMEGVTWPTAISVAEEFHTYSSLVRARSQGRDPTPACKREEPEGTCT